MAEASVGGSLIAHTRYATDDPDAAHEFLTRRYARHRVRLHERGEAFRFALTGRSAGQISLARLCHSAAGTATSDPFPHLVFGAICAGKVELVTGREQVRGGQGGAYLYPVGSPFTVSWDRCDIHLLNLPRTVLADQAAAQTGIAADDLRFEAMTPVSSAMTRYWRATVGMVNRELAAPDSALAHPLTQAATLAMLATAALSCFPNTAMSAYQLPGPGRVAPAALRRAVAYIDAHADQPVTVTEIATAAGLSARALQHAFKQHRHTSPLGYLARVRLERAHRDLQAGDPSRGDTVTTIAQRWGFTNPGRFATTYRRTYQVNPSHTLRT
ncbi:MAG TPA: AraC family transcriptional regulator [Pseudonocardia sp.]